MTKEHKILLVGIALFLGLSFAGLLMQSAEDNATLSLLIRDHRHMVDNIYE